MDCDKQSVSRRYDLKYASYDALNTKKRYSHVQSKVKTYIDNMRKEDQERRKVRITRHRSEPSELAEWNASEDLNESNATNLQLVLERKNLEFDEMKSRLNEIKTYADTTNELLNAERLRRKELQKKLDAIRDNLTIANSCTWSDPGFRIADNDKIGRRVINTTDTVDMYAENGDENVSIEWLGKIGSEEELIADENDDTILLQPIEDIQPVKKGMKYRMKKILRCCAPCIKPKVV